MPCLLRSGLESIRGESLCAVLHPRCGGCHQMDAFPAFEFCHDACPQWVNGGPHLTFWLVCLVVYFSVWLQLPSRQVAPVKATLATLQTLVMLQVLVTLQALVIPQALVTLQTLVTLQALVMMLQTLAVLQALVTPQVRMRERKTVVRQAPLMYGGPYA